MKVPVSELWPPKVLRASSLPDYGDCMRRGVARALPEKHAEYVAGPEFAEAKKRVSFQHISAIVGTMLHQAMEADGEQQFLARLMKIEGDIRYDRTTSNPQEAAAQCVRMSRQLHQDLPRWKDGAVLERRLEHKPDWTEYTLSGKPDRVLKDEQGRSVVHDLKTSAYPPSVKHAAQIGAYGLLLQGQGEELSDVAYIHHLPRVSLKKDQPPVTTYGYDMGECLWQAMATIRNLARLEREADVMIFEPYTIRANPSSVLCNPDWCPAHSTPFCNLSRMFVSKPAVENDDEQ